MTTPPDEMEAQIDALRIEMSKLTQSVAWVDNMLVLVLQELMAKSDASLASLFVHSQASIERRVSLVRKVLENRLSRWLKEKPHTYDYKLATFLIRCFNAIWEEISPHLWMRNFAAHGDLHQGPPPFVTPQVFDSEGVAKLYEKKGVKQTGWFPEIGLTATELSAASKAITAGYLKFYKLIEFLQVYSMPVLIEQLIDAKVAELGKGLKLQPPLRQRPRRAAKLKRTPKGQGLTQGG